jgi:hypothetical protein
VAIFNVAQNFFAKNATEWYFISVWIFQISPPILLLVYATSALGLVYIALHTATFRLYKIAEWHFLNKIEKRRVVIRRQILEHLAKRPIDEDELVQAIELLHAHVDPDEIRLQSIKLFDTSDVTEVNALLALPDGWQQADDEERIVLAITPTGKKRLERLQWQRRSQ